MRSSGKLLPGANTAFRLLHATNSYWIQAGPCRIVRCRLRDATPEFGFKVLAVEDLFRGGHHLLITSTEAFTVAFGIGRGEPRGPRGLHKGITAVCEGTPVRLCRGVPGVRVLLVGRDDALAGYAAAIRRVGEVEAVGHSIFEEHNEPSGLPAVWTGEAIASHDAGGRAGGIMGDDGIGYAAGLVAIHHPPARVVEDEVVEEASEVCISDARQDSDWGRDDRPRVLHGSFALGESDEVGLEVLKAGAAAAVDLDEGFGFALKSDKLVGKLSGIREWIG